MQKIIRSGSVRMYLYIGSVLVIAGVWRMGEAVNLRLANLPVKEVQRVGQEPIALDAKGLYPVWVKQAASAGIASQADVEGLFRKAEPALKSPGQMPDAQPAPPPDYAGMFKQLARVDGVSNDGVFLNGRFYRVGQVIDALPLGFSGSAPVVPVVESIDQGRVVFRVGKAQVAFIVAE